MFVRPSVCLFDHIVVCGNSFVVFDVSCQSQDPRQISLPYRHHLAVGLVFRVIVKTLTDHVADFVVTPALLSIGHVNLQTDGELCKIDLRDFS